MSVRSTVSWTAKHARRTLVATSPTPSSITQSTRMVMTQSYASGEHDELSPDNDDHHASEIGTHAHPRASESIRDPRTTAGACSSRAQASRASTTGPSPTTAQPLHSFHALRLRDGDGALGPRAEGLTSRGSVNEKVVPRSISLCA